MGWEGTYVHPRWPFPALTTEAGWEVSCLSDGTSSLFGVAVLSQQPSFTVLGPGRSWAKMSATRPGQSQWIPLYPRGAEWNSSPTGLRLGRQPGFGMLVEVTGACQALDVLALVHPQVVFV